MWCLYVACQKIFVKSDSINTCPAEPKNVLLLQTVYIQISWLLKKPTDLDLHCVIKYVNLDQQPWSSNMIGWKLEVDVAS